MNAALRAYSSTARTGLVGRALEAAVLHRCAVDLHRSASEGPEAWDGLLDALERNRQVWRLLAAEARAEDSDLPADVRRNLLTVAAFIFSRTVVICETADRAEVPALVHPIVECNRHLAAGLEGRAA